MGRVWTIFIVAIIGLFITSYGWSGQCDRACLTGFADQYLKAMVAHDASKAPFAEKVIFTENTIRLPLTEGLWFTSSGLGDFGIYICDLQTNQIAWCGCR